MPDITISAEQAEALARGENIMIVPAAPEPVETFKVVITAKGSVVEFKLLDGDPVAQRKLRHSSVTPPQPRGHGHLRPLPLPALHHWRDITSPAILSWARRMCEDGRVTSGSAPGTVVSVEKSAG